MGKRASNKRQIVAWIDVGLDTQIRAEAERRGITKTDVLVTALREHFKIDPIPASAAQLDEIKTALVALRQSQQETLSCIQQTSTPIIDVTEPETRPHGFIARLFGR